MRDNAGDSRIRPDDELIDLSETLRLMGGKKKSAAYDDAELQELKLKVGPSTGPQSAVRFIKREVLDLRARRVARSEADAPTIRAQVEKRLALRREKRQRRASTAGTMTSTA